MSDSKYNEYQKLYRDLQTAVAGVDVTVTVKALADSLALLVAVGAKDQQAAIDMLNALGPYMQLVLTQQWDTAREMRARAAATTPPTSTTLN